MRSKNSEEHHLNSLIRMILLKLGFPMVELFSPIHVLGIKNCTSRSGCGSYPGTKYWEKSKYSICTIYSICGALWMFPLSVPERIRNISCIFALVQCADPQCGMRIHALQVQLNMKLFYFLHQISIYILRFILVFLESEYKRMVTYQCCHKISTKNDYFDLNSEDSDNNLIF